MEWCGLGSFVQDRVDLWALVSIDMKFGFHKSENVLYNQLIPAQQEEFRGFSWLVSHFLVRS
jgi:hypothetical protein